jgi:hypothetical protein
MAIGLRRRPHTGLGKNGRAIDSVRLPAPTQRRKDGEVKEMHATKHQQDETNLGTELLEGFLRVGSRRPIAQRQSDVSNVNQVEADDEKMIYRISERLVSQEAINQEYATVFVESTGHPHGQTDADREVSEIQYDDPVHTFSPFAVVVFSFFLSRQIEKRAFAARAVRPTGGGNPGRFRTCLFRTEGIEAPPRADVEKNAPEAALAILVSRFCHHRSPHSKKINCRGRPA